MGALCSGVWAPPTFLLLPACVDGLPLGHFHPTCLESASLFRRSEVEVGQGASVGPGTPPWHAVYPRLITTPAEQMPRFVLSPSFEAMKYPWTTGVRPFSNRPRAGGRRSDACTILLPHQGDSPGVQTVTVPDSVLQPADPDSSPRHASISRHTMCLIIPPEA